MKEKYKAKYLCSIQHWSFVVVVTFPRKLHFLYFLLFLVSIITSGILTSSSLDLDILMVNNIIIYNINVITVELDRQLEYGGTPKHEILSYRVRLDHIKNQKEHKIYIIL